MLSCFLWIDKRKGYRVQEQTGTRREMITAFGLMIPLLRKLLQLSQTEFGKRISVSRQSISSFERGDTPMSWTIYISAVTFFTINKVEVLQGLVAVHSAFIESELKM